MARPLGVGRNALEIGMAAQDVELPVAHHRILAQVRRGKRGGPDGGGRAGQPEKTASDQGALDELFVGPGSEGEPLPQRRMDA